MPHLSFVFICLVWGSSFILIERARHAFGPIDVALGRVAGGALVLALAWWYSGRRYRASSSDLWRVAFASLVGTVLPFVLLAYCIAPGRFGHSYFAVMVAFVPLATIAISIPMLGVWPSARQLIGVLGGLACMLVLVQDGSARGMPWGLVALAVAVPIGYATGNTFVKWKLSHIPAVPLTTLLLTAATAMLLPLEGFPALLAEMSLSRPASPQHIPVAIASLVFLSVVGTGIAIWLFNRLIIKHGPLYAGMVTYVFPLFALGWGMFDAEQITLRQLAAMAGVLTMVALVQFGSGRPRAGGPKQQVKTDAYEPSRRPDELPVVSVESNVPAP